MNLNKINYAYIGTIVAIIKLHIEIQWLVLWKNKYTYKVYRRWVLKYNFYII